MATWEMSSWCCTETRPLWRAPEQTFSRPHGEVIDQLVALKPSLHHDGGSCQR